MQDRAGKYGMKPEQADTSDTPLTRDVPLTRPELVQLVVRLAEALDVAPSLEDEKRIMAQIFQHALSYEMLTAEDEP
jgi:hypothetical protein